MGFRSWASAGMLVCVLLVGCGSESAPKPPAKVVRSAPKPWERPKVSVRLDEYRAMSKVSGRVLGDGQGAVTLGICTVKEWSRCKVEKRPPIPAETTTVVFGEGHDGAFTFSQSDAMVPPFYVFTPPDSEFRIDPTLVGKIETAP